MCDLEVALKEKEAHIDALNEQVNEAEDTLSSSQKSYLAKLHDREREAGSLQEQLDDLAGKVSERDAEIRALNGELEQLRETSDIKAEGLNAEIKRLHSVKEALESEKSKMESDCVAAKSECVDLQNTIDALRDELVTVEGSLDKQKEELLVGGNKLAEAKAEFESENPEPAVS